jgi:hypothetical protein
VGDALGPPVGAFFVGPGKCGTSWVFETCRAHAALNVGRIKEPGAFLAPAVDLAAYEALWEGPGLRCDFSNTYIFSDTAAEGVHRYNPSARIGITVREPVARLVSQYMFMRRNARFDGTIDAWIRAYPEIVDRCRYGRHAQRWLERFAAPQVTVLRLETLQQQPEAYRKALFEFLGVPDDPAAAAKQQAQAAALPRSRLLARGTKELADLARKARLFRLIDLVKRSPLASLLYRPLPSTYQQGHREAVPQDLRAELEAHYASFLESLARRWQVRLV